MSMDVSAYVSFGITFDVEDYTWEELDTRFNFSEEYESFYDWIYEQKDITFIPRGYGDCETVGGILALPKSSISIEWDDVLDIQKFLSGHGDSSLTDIMNYLVWLSKYGFGDEEPVWLVSTYYG